MLLLFFIALEEFLKRARRLIIDCPCPAGMFDALRSRWAIFGAIAIGLYVGAEVSIGSIMINFLNQPDVLGLSFEEAGGHLANFYWGGALLGRIVGTLLLTRVRAGQSAGDVRPDCGAAVPDRRRVRRTDRGLCGACDRVLQLDHVPDDLHHHARALRRVQKLDIRPAVPGDLRRSRAADDSR